MSAIDWSRWINFQEYTPIEMFFFAGGCFLWVIVYAIYVRQILKHKYVEMPYFAGAVDFGWEFTWSFLLATNMGLLLQWTYQAWFFFDLFIFGGLLVYGWKQLATPKLRSVFAPMCITVAAGGAAATYFLYTSGLDEPIGAVSAYLAQLLISILYVGLLLRQGDPERFSLWAAWLRTIGTLMNTIFMNIHYPDNYFLRFISIAAAPIDFTYIYLLWRIKRAAVRSEVSQPSVNLPATSPTS
jgi:hypothetical protein